MLKVIETLPEGLLTAQATELQDMLGGPTLMHLPGRRSEPLFVSVLLHGNEDTGFHALQALLQRFQGQELPRALSVFFGNVSAAKQRVRRLDGQPDYNRVWPGGEAHDTPEYAMMQQILAEMEARNVFAAIDVHNNTGMNPHYGCINRIDHRYLHLATLFSRTVVYFTRPRGVASLAFSQLCPSVTVECGKPGQAHGVDHATDFINAALHLSDLPVHPVSVHDLDLFHTIATITVPQALSFGFGEPDRDITFASDLDRLNFRELPAGTMLGRPTGSKAIRLEAWDERARDIGDRYFAVEEGELRTLKPLMPSMFTLNETVIRQDCLGYLMERYELVTDDTALEL